MKDSFVLYNSFYEPIKALKNEQLGKLLRAIFNYTINGEITQDSDILIAFMFIKNQLDMDAKKWKDIRQKRSEAGKKHKGNQYTNDNKMEQMEQNGTNGSVNVNVNVDDNVYNKKENTKRKKFDKPTIDEIRQYCLERSNGIDAEAFYDFYEAKDWCVGKNKMKDWKACVRTWEKRNNKTEILPEWYGKKVEKEQVSDEEAEELKEMFKDFM